jgi:DNA-binding XRE family transcriptional regulator
VRILCARHDEPAAGGDGHGAPRAGHASAGGEPGAPRDGTLLLLAAAADHARTPDKPDSLAGQARARYWAMVAAGNAPRPGRDAAPGEPAAYDRASFPRAFLPGEAPGLASEAADRGRPHRLSELRARAGFTQAQVAERLGVRQERISALERGELTAAEARTLAAYVAALGGRLEITVEFGTDRLFLG